MTAILKILFIEDSKSDAELIWHEIEKNKMAFNKLLVDNKQDFLDSLKSFNPDIIISDYSLPQLNGMSALLLRNELTPFTPFLLVTGSINEEVAVECIKAGADDYILKENLSRLVPAIISSLNKSKLTREKRATEEELLKSEQRLQKAQSIAHVGNWELDLSTRLVWCSDEALIIYGFENDKRELPLELVQNIPLPEYRPILDEIFNHLLKYNETYEVEFKIKRNNDGALRTIFSKAELVVEPESNKVKVIGVIQDITERKRAEEALAESEMKYRNIFENIQDIYYEATFDGTLIDISPSIEAFSKGLYKREDLIGKSMFEFYAFPAEREKFLTSIKEKGSVTDFEITIKNRDGSFVPCSISSGINFDDSGNPVKIIGSLRDITERKKAEEAISQERRMLRTLIDNLPDTIYVQDLEGKKVIANVADVRHAGFSTEDEVLGRTDLDLYPGEPGKRGYAENMSVITTGKPIIDLEDEFIDRNGSTRWLQTTKFPLYDKSGQIAGLVGIGHDITERKMVEDELVRSKLKAEESDKLKTAFLHNISHEIRTPMNAIVGFSALLGEPDIDKQSRESYIEVIMQSSNHLLAIITDIVDISNIEANLIKTMRNEININMILKSLVRHYSPEARKKNIELVYVPGLSDKDAQIITDNTKLNQVLTNLLSNALKFTEKGNVKISYVLKEGFLEFMIADTGIGIAPEHFDKIFDRFYQIQNNVSRLYEGTGLGLSISKAYVEHMDGKIWLTSEPGRGTTFYVSIPYEKADKAPVKVIQPRVQDGLVFPVRKVILVAEDVESNFKLIKYFLTGSNAEVLHAFNGKEAVDKCIANKNIDLILMDIKMPVMDGYTAVKLIREKNIKIPIIAQTAYADDRDKAIEYGCSGFISKPFDKKALFKILQEFI